MEPVLAGQALVHVFARPIVVVLAIAQAVAPAVVAVVLVAVFDIQSLALRVESANLGY
jgi:hypothetical protein